MIDPSCYFCKNTTVANGCLDCKFKYSLRAVSTFNDRHTGEKNNKFIIEHIFKDKIYFITYDIFDNKTHINYTTLKEDHKDEYIRSFDGFLITPANIATKLPMYLLFL